MDYVNFKKLDGITFENLIIAGARYLKSHETEINDLNVFPIPDGDTGSNMYRTLNGGIEAMRKVNSTRLDQKIESLGSNMVMNARGNSGVILSQLFYGIAEGFKGVEVATIDDIIKAMHSGVERAYKAVVSPVEGTILTVARETWEETSKKAASYDNLYDYIKDGVNIMTKSLDNTPNLLKVLKDAGVVDSGGAGLLYIIYGIKDALEGKNVEDIEESLNISAPTVNALDLDKFTKDSEMTFGYCTEVLVRLMTKKVDVEAFDEKVIIDYLQTIGDSIVCFKLDSIVKVHVHTFEPYKVLQFCQQFGEFLTIKIENMTIQHNETHFFEENKKEAPLIQKVRPHKKYGLITVADGSGIIEFFKNLGVDIVIDGGQGKNPAIADFVEAFKEINCDNIYVLPNNSNIILAANQAKELYKDANIYVVPTKNFGEAYGALSMLVFEDRDPDDIFKDLCDNIHNNKTYQISRAIRDTLSGSLDIKEGDYIIFENKNILANGKTIPELLHNFKEVDNLKEYEILTILFGKDVNKIDQGNIKAWVKELNSDLEVYEIDGQQEIFDFIMILE